MRKVIRNRLFRDAFFIALFTLTLTLGSAAAAFGMENPEYQSIDSLPEDEQIVSGGYYSFSGYLTSDINMTASERKKRLLTASHDTIRFGDLERDVICDSVQTQSNYDDSIVWNNDSKFVFQITEVNSTDEGNQGYTIKNVEKGWYLDVKQGLQHVLPYPRQHESYLGLPGGTAHRIYGLLLPTYPFVYLSNTARTWYWDAENKEFYTRFTTRSYDDSYFGYRGAPNFLEVYREPDRIGQTEDDYEFNEEWYALAGDYDDGQGQKGFSLFMWMNRYIFCNAEDLGIYGPHRHVNQRVLDSDIVVSIQRSNSKFVLQGFNASGKEDAYHVKAVEDLRDPYYYWGWIRNDCNHSTAMLGVYHELMSWSFRDYNPQAERDKLTVYKRITSPTVTFDYNDGTDGSRTEQFYYNQTVDRDLLPPLSLKA